MNSVKPIIEVHNIGKKYNITHMKGGYVALRDVISSIFRNPFSFLKSKAKQVVGLEKKEAFWALRNVSFTVNAGEIVGIIGANGAGKSTLLKILSQITPPTEGEIILRGRVGSLLEVGTGFHPELTGRENIFLNGAILGMKKREIADKFDQIVEFAGIERFLDTPVKHYSSGMYVRLAFSVAAHMEPDILIIDEVLAVGDAEFQKKCLGKMDEITKQHGRTILFVSHNLSAVKQLCNRTILLKNGMIEFEGDTEQVTNYYVSKIISPRMNDLEHIETKNRLKRSHESKVAFLKAVSVDTQGNTKEFWSFRYDEKLYFKFKCKVKIACDGLSLLMRITDSKSKIQIGNFKQIVTKKALEVGEIISFKIEIPSYTIRPGEYYVSFALGNIEANFWYDIIDENVNIPPLVINPIDTDPHTNAGFVTIPATVTDISV